MFQMCSTNNRCPQQSVASLTNIFLLEDLLGRVEEHHTYLCVCFWFCAHFAVLDCFYTKKHGKVLDCNFLDILAVAVLVAVLVAVAVCRCRRDSRRQFGACFKGSVRRITGNYCRQIKSGDTFTRFFCLVASTKKNVFFVFFFSTDVGEEKCIY